jgi:hypothetical protein
MVDPKQQSNTYFFILAWTALILVSVSGILECHKSELFGKEPQQQSKKPSGWVPDQVHDQKWDFFLDRGKQTSHKTRR